MRLPSVNTKEDLETNSGNKFRLLFDVARFEIRPEERRDKGIDFNLEIKKNGFYTNFRSVIQLKATSSIPSNNDGSYSLQLETSNINYLLNSGLPAFYILYIEQTDIFYYEEVSIFVYQLSEKNPNWLEQATNVLRFCKPINTSAIDYFYEHILKKGQFQRQIHERLALRNSAISNGDKISFDVDLNVTDDTQIRNAIETYGILLDHQGNWIDIIKMHNQASGAVATTAKYNLIVGIANYQTGNLSQAMTFFRIATKLKTELTPLLQNHLQFFDITTRYAIGILSEIEYIQKTSELENDPSIGLYVKLDKAKRKYLTSDSISPEDRFNSIYIELQNIINDVNATQNIILEAKCELVLYEGFKNNINYVKVISGLNSLEEEIGTDLNARTNHAQIFATKFMEWHNNVQRVREDAINSKNDFPYFHSILNEVKITYEFCVYKRSIQELRETHGFPKEEMYDQEQVFSPLLKMLDEAFDYYNSIDHVLNKAAVLAQKYEIIHYMENTTQAKAILSELEILINNYDLIELIQNLEYLKSEGPTHTRFDTWLIRIFEKRKKYAEISKKQEEEMREMDHNDWQANKLKENFHQIDLFPIGNFQFPKEKLKKAFEILNITSNNTKMQFENMFTANIVPIANIYNNPIIQEGPLNGELANKGLEAWENLYRVRKAFYENKFYRIA